MKTWTKSSKNRIDSVLSVFGPAKAGLFFLCGTEYGGMLDIRNVQRCFVSSTANGGRLIAEVS